MKKKLLAILLIATMALSMASCSNNVSELDALKKENASLKKQIELLQEELNAASTAPDAQTNSDSLELISDDDIFTIGDILTLENVCTFVFTDVSDIDERSTYEEKTPAQVIRLTYDYENLGSTLFPTGLLISSSSFQVVDEKGELAKPYSIIGNNFPESTPIGAKFVGAQETYGLNNVSSKIKVILTVHDNNNYPNSVTFELPIE